MEYMEKAKANQASPRWYRLQIWARKVFNRLPLREQQKLYILTLLIGGICGLAAVLFHVLLDFFQDHIIYHTAAIPNWWHIPLLIAIPAAGGLIAGAGLYFYAPEARGSGIPQVKTAFYLNSGRIPARIIPAKMLLAAFQKVSRIASKNLLHAHPDHTLDIALVKLGRKGVSQLPVVSRRDTSKLLGIITMNDIARALSKEDEQAEATVDVSGA